MSSLRVTTWAAAPAIDRRVILRFVAAGNLLGYVKLLHRSADVLLVAAFCGDRGTGIYKLARSITDALTKLTASGRAIGGTGDGVYQASPREE